jgi:hypothetical protein
MYVNKAEKLLKQLLMVGVLKVKDENSRTRSRIWILIHTIRQKHGSLDPDLTIFA